LSFYLDTIRYRNGGCREGKDFELVTGQSQTRGRPRDPATENRILDITLGQLGKYGYSRMSIDRIAAEAGVSKPTIYRRWTDKADLATAALARLRLSEQPQWEASGVDTLKSILRSFRRSLFRPNGMALIGTVLAEEQHNPDLLQLFRERVVAPRRAMIRRVLRLAAEEGLFPPKSDMEAATAMIVGSFYAAYLAEGPVSPAWCDRVAELAWKALAAPSAPATGGDSARRVTPPEPRRSRGRP
jgi:AcrR family transcriptional regulator